MSLKLSVDEAIKELEDIAVKIESGNVPIEDLVLMYSRASELKHFCLNKLNNLQTTIEKIKCAETE